MANPQLTILTELFLDFITLLVYLILILHPHATRSYPIVYGDFTDFLKHKHCIIPRIIELTWLL